MRDLKRQRRDLVIFIYDYCQNWEGEDLSFISRPLLRKQKFIDLAKAKRAVVDGRFPRLLVVMLQEHKQQTQRRVSERRWQSQFAFSR